MAARHPPPHQRQDSSAVPHVASEDDADAPLSKTKRKATMHALQDLGEELVGLDARRFSELAMEVELPEQLVEAILQARTITAWGGRKRQLQYIGKLMRGIDPEPIRRRLDAWAHGHREETARLHQREQWRDRLLNEADGLESLAIEYPQLDRSKFRALISQARAERASGGPPHASRELFRALKALEAK